MSQEPQQLEINPRHVALQFARRAGLQGARFLLDEIAQRMLDRLQYIRITPTKIIDMGCGPGLRVDALREKYPKADYVGVDSCPPFIQVAQAQYAPKGLGGLWKKLSAQSPAEFLLKDMANTAMPPESAELIWSNLALHWHPSPEQVMAEWRRLLKVGGLCMFSCFGPHTFIELREAVARAGIQTQTMSFVDMHDFGDIMLEHGFIDPVMDQEMLTLTYKTPEKLLADVYQLGGNPSTQRGDGLRGKQWYQHLLTALEEGRKADGFLHLTLEVAYGHAWRSGTMKGPAGETKISIGAIKRI
ncbi:MAG: methyltransferase domain-containing protein [Pelistega sp.]|nr:methyltransferase domain-containing protein [Pelistega sp.]